jgi:uncharacterized protein (TIGR03067 family)
VLNPTNPTHVLIGRWQMIRAELAGEVAPELVTGRMILELGEGTYAVAYAGEISDSGAWEIGREEGTLILNGRSGPNAGRNIPCLYQQAGDRLRVCFGLDGVSPVDFATAGRAGRYTAIYRRL